jgi:hypothetical protein
MPLALTSADHDNATIRKVLVLSQTDNNYNSITNPYSVRETRYTGPDGISWATDRPGSRPHCFY